MGIYAVCMCGSTSPTYNVHTHAHLVSLLLSSSGCSLLQSEFVGLGDRDGILDGLQGLGVTMPNLMTERRSGKAVSQGWVCALQSAFEI